MLTCSCNWRGVNLVPNYNDNTARCPECAVVFVGIPPEHAIVASPEENHEIVKQADAELAIILIAEALTKKK